MTAPRVAVLYARRDSVYKSLSGCDVYDETRDARTFAGGCPVIAHPPCRAWGGLRHMAKPVPGERELALHALSVVRRWGGVLEHPRRSELWPVCELPMGDQVDEYGGFSLLINQCWWGHLAEKPSLLYVCGVDRRDVPPVVVDLTAPGHIVGGTGRRRDGSRGVLQGWRPDLSRRLREATPPALAVWLVELASRAARASRAPRAVPSSPAARLEEHGRGAHGGRAAPASSGRTRLEHRVGPAGAVVADRTSSTAGELSTAVEHG